MDCTHVCKYEYHSVNSKLLMKEEQAAIFKIRDNSPMELTLHFTYLYMYGPKLLQGHGKDENGEFVINGCFEIIDNSSIND
jgi:hypothetical protein